MLWSETRDVSQERLVEHTELLIGGVSRPASDGKTFERKNPLSGEVVTRAAAATAEDADAAVQAAAAAGQAWASVAPGKRRELLLKAADLLEARVADFIERGAGETGASAAWIGFNVHLGAGVLREAAAMTTQIAGEVIPSNVPGSLALAIRQPAGVVLGIAPWNAPVILAVRAIAMPLACGNTVILKASEMCPAAHSLIGTVLAEAGLAPGVVNVITNAPEDAAAVVERLVAHPLVRRVNFTGSTGVGRVIAKLAAQHLKPVLLELGGKAPLLVLDDADIDAAVQAAAFGAFFNQGQICMSTERIIVDNAVADDFVVKLSAKAKTLRAGDPRDAKNVLATLISPESGAKVTRLIEDAVQHGAELACGGEVDGCVAQASVLDKVTPAMKIYAEESFGPVVAVMRVNGEDEAIRVANDSSYGLSSAVFTRDTARGLRVAARLQSGICHINGPTVHDEAQMPFGGVKDSGYGRFGGRAAIAEFTDLRWITVQTGERHYPI